jgi:hypothetical protein
MARAALRIEVTKKDQNELRKLLSGGVQQVRVVLRVLALLQLGKGVSAPRISAAVPLTPQAIRKVGHRYLEGGLERALYEFGLPIPIPAAVCLNMRGRSPPSCNQPLCSGSLPRRRACPLLVRMY